MSGSPRLSTFGLLCCVVMLLVASAAPVCSQGRDHRGKEFYLAFMPTDGAETGGRYWIDITSDSRTSGTLTFMKTGLTNNIVIEAGQTYHLQLDTDPLWLPDINGEISKKTVRLWFQTPVTVHGLNTQRWSSDGFLALPVESLGTSYIVLSYPNTISSDSMQASHLVADFPSQFAVIGANANTTVTITPTAQINRHGSLAPLTISLNYGDVFLAQCKAQAGIDFTGTTIVSNKPVAVIAGNQRSNIPWDEAVGRDHLVEQLPPTNYWKTSAIVVPTFQLDKTIPDVNVVRLIGASQTTHINVNDLPYATVGAGVPVELYINRPTVITADGPILVAQYLHSTVDADNLPAPKPDDSVGDPFMAIVPAPEQYLDSYSFYSYDTKDFFHHYVNVIIPEENRGSLMLDGKYIEPEFHPIGGTWYSYAQIEVSSGAHAMSASTPFGLMVYGYGPYNSYGFPAGIMLQPPPADAPEHNDQRTGRISATIRSHSSDWSRVDLDVTAAGDFITIEVVNALGARVMIVRKELSGARRISLNMSDLPSAMYYLRVIDNTGAIATTPLALLR